MKDSSTALCDLATLLRRLAKIAFVSVLILIPMRMRIVLLSRPDLPVQNGYTDFLLFAPDVAMLATLGFWGLSLLAARRRLHVGPVTLWLPLTGVSLAGLVSTVTSVDPALTLYHSVRLAALFAFFVYIVNEIAAHVLVVTAVAVQGVIQAAFAIAQFLLQHSVGVPALGEYALDPAQRGISIVSSGTGRVLRAYGLSDHPNILGGCLAFGLVLLLAAYLWSGGKRRLLAGIPFLPMSLALFFTFSRSAWLAFLSGAAFLVAIQVSHRRWTALKALAWLALAGGMVLAPFIWKNANLIGIRLGVGGALSRVPAEEQSAGERLLLIAAGERILAAHTLTGIGLGAAPVAMRNEYPQLTTGYQPPHWTLLDAALETGLPGGVSYFLLLILPWAGLLRQRGLLIQPGVAGAAALLLAVTAVGFFDYYTWLLVPGRLWQWVSWGLLAASVRTAHNNV